MDLNALVGVFSLACLLGTILFLNRLRRKKLVYITDFQIGVKFGDSGACEVLPAGAYRSNDGGSSIMIVDMRPYPFLFERMPFKNVLLADSLISVGGELAVQDPQLAVTKLKKIFEDSLPIIREGVLVTCSRMIADSTSAGRTSLAEAISADLNGTLGSSGIRVQNIEITELWVRQVDTHMAAAAN